MTAPQHHPDEAVLLDYAAGSLAEPLALLVATHLALCPECRRHSQELEAVGGTLLAAQEPASVADSVRARCLAHLDCTEPQGGPAPAMPEIRRSAPSDAQDLRVPEPLHSYLGRGLDELGWRSVLPGLAEYKLELGRNDMQTKLLRVAGGKAMPHHTHAGRESTLVLCGAYNDESGRFARGDVALLDDDHEHQPVAEPGEACICLAVLEAPLRLTGPVGRLFNRFLRF